LANRCPNLSTFAKFLSNDGICHDAWMANTTPLCLAQQSNPRPGAQRQSGGSQREFYLAEDFSQADNLAAQNPNRIESNENRTIGNLSSQVLPVL
jgi:hypothetical protein